MEAGAVGAFFLTTAGILLIGSGLSGAATLETTVTATVISDGSGNSRVLLEPGDLSAIRGKLVTRATLVVDLPDVATASDLRVEVSPVLTDWSAGTVSWTSPWVNDGGDLDDAYYDIVTLPAGSRGGTLRLDVSGAVRAMALGEIGEYGLVLTVPEFVGAGFRSSELAALGTLSSAKLQVDYKARTRVAMAAQTRGPQASVANKPQAERAPEEADRPR